MKITVKKLEELRACSEGIDMFREAFPDGGAFRDIAERVIEIGGDALVYALWLAPRLMTKDNAVRFAIYAAREVLPIFEAKYPGDKRPRKAIEAAEAWLENQSEETANAAARAAAYAARAAAYAARAAEYAAAYSAYSAYAARAAAYAAADAAADARRMRRVRLARLVMSLKSSCCVTRSSLWK